MAWSRVTWVDDDGSLTVGTPFSAAHMNNIEEGIEEALKIGAMTPILVPNGTVFTVPKNRQALWAMSIVIEGNGVLEVNGTLVEVD